MNVVLQNPYVNESESVRSNLVGVTTRSYTEEELHTVMRLAALEDIDLNEKTSKLSGG